MKACTRFHFDDLEKGDKVFLKRDSDDPDDKGFTITVSRTQLSKRFGPSIIDKDGKTFWLWDFDITEEAS